MPLTAKSAKKSKYEDIHLVHTPLPEHATHKFGGATGNGSTPDSSAVLLELRANWSASRGAHQRYLVSRSA